MQNNKVVACIGEKFLERGSHFYSPQTTTRFIQECFGFENVKVVSIAESNQEALQIENMGSCVEKSDFYQAPLPGECSTKVFYQRSIFEKHFYKSYVEFVDKIISENQDATFWVRTPSPMSIIFAFRVMKAKKPLIHHICGDARLTWKDSKYSGISKVLAFCFSFIVVQQLKRICSYQKVLNLTSGSALYDFAAKFSSESTEQFVDVMCDPPKDHITKNKSKQLLFIGRVVDDKGIFEIINALPSLTEYSLVVAGSGSELDKAKQRVASLNLQERVSFLGHVNLNRVKELIEESYATLMLSKTNEGFPRVILESWNAFTPCIVTQVGGVNAFVKHNENALVIEPGNQQQLMQALAQISKEDVYKTLVYGIRKESEFTQKSYWFNMLRLRVRGII